MVERLRLSAWGRTLKAKCCQVPMRPWLAERLRPTYDRAIEANIWLSDWGHVWPNTWGLAWMSTYEAMGGRAVKTKVWPNTLGQDWLSTNDAMGGWVVEAKVWPNTWGQNWLGTYKVMGCRVVEVMGGLAVEAKVWPKTWGQDWSSTYEVMGGRVVEAKVWLNTWGQDWLVLVRPSYGWTLEAKSGRVPAKPWMAEQFQQVDVEWNKNTEVEQLGNWRLPKYRSLVLHGYKGGYLLGPMMDAKMFQVWGSGQINTPCHT